MQVDRNYTLKEYYSLIQKTVPTFKGDYARDNGVRLWRYQATTPDPLKSLYNEIKKQTQDFDYNDDMVFEFGGEYLDPNKYNTIEDIGIIPTDVIIVEVYNIIIASSNNPVDHGVLKIQQWKWRANVRVVIRSKY